MTQEEIKKELAQIEKEIFELDKQRIIAKEELSILISARRLVEKGYRECPFLNLSIMNEKFLEEKIKEYTDKVDNLARKTNKLLKERDRLLYQLERS